MRHTLLRASPLVTLLIVVLLLPTIASAQTRTFARLGDIHGDSTVPGHENWVEVSALRQAWAPGWSTSSCTVDLVKGLDQAGPMLWWIAVTKQHFDRVRIDVDRVAGDGLQTAYVIELEFAQITGIVTTGALPFAETVTLKSQRMTLTYYPQLRDGTPGAPVSKIISCP